jgi:hypothetical protein
VLLFDFFRFIALWIVTLKHLALSPATGPFRAFVQAKPDSERLTPTWVALNADCTSHPTKRRH